MRRAQPWLGTLVEISIGDPLPDALLLAAFARAFEAVAQVHALMSFHAADSDVARFNRAPVGSLLDIDSRTREVLALALHMQQASAGLFDVCCAPRLVQWNYLPDPGTALPVWPAAGAGFELSASGGLRKLNAAWIDLGGIAKGYAVDQAIEALQCAGVGSACVNAGGDLRVLGQEAWPIAIRSPAAPTRSAATVQVANQALATSASYFSRSQQAGCAASALLDGRSGAAITDARSISVMAPRCMPADALTKVIAASGDIDHPALACFGARAFII